MRVQRHSDYLCYNNQSQFNVFFWTAICGNKAKYQDWFILLPTKYEPRLKKQHWAHNTAPLDGNTQIDEINARFELNIRNDHWMRVRSSTWIVWQPTTWWANGKCLQNFHTDIPSKRSLDSMVDTMTWVSAESQGNVVQLPMGGRHFSRLQNIRTSSMVHQVSYSMDAPSP